MKSVNPRTLQGSIVLIVLGAIIVSQVLTALLLKGQRDWGLVWTQEGEMVHRVSNIVDLLKRSNPLMHPTIVHVSDSPTFQVELGKLPLVAVNSEVALSQRLQAALGKNALEVRATWQALHPNQKSSSSSELFEIPVAGPAPGAANQRQPLTSEPVESASRFYADRAGVRLLCIAVRLSADRWLNITALKLPPDPSLATQLLVSAILSALLVATAAAWAAGRSVRPIASLTAAAERLGRGEPPQPVPVEGPEDIRRANRAFNAMAERLDRMLSDQKLLLSAVGHDLRTPIASLRVRAELIADKELRERMIATLADMEELTEAALSVVRGGDTGEPHRRIELASLVEAVCDDMRDIGQPVSLDELPRVWCHGRSGELRRALRNLLDNAMRYAGSAHVGFVVRGDSVDINVDDDGPGIAPDQIESLTRPFVRLETSRSRSTGGFGLGLSIARSIVQRHGGTLLIANRKPSGLRVTLRLPCEKKSA